MHRNPFLFTTSFWSPSILFWKWSQFICSGTLELQDQIENVWPWSRTMRSEVNLLHKLVNNVQLQMFGWTMSTSLLRVWEERCFKYSLIQSVIIKFQGFVYNLNLQSSNDCVWYTAPCAPAHGYFIDPQGNLGNALSPLQCSLKVLLCEYVKHYLEFTGSPSKCQGPGFTDV